LLAQIIEAAQKGDAVSLAKDLGLANAELEKLFKTKPLLDPTLNANGTPLSAEEIQANRINKIAKQYNPLLKKENDRLTLLEKQNKLMNDQNNAAQEAIGYATQQTDLQGQIRMAMASGDYLKANLLRQQMAGAADKYQMGIISNQNQQIIDKGRELYATVQEKVSSGSNPTAAYKDLKNYKPQLGKYNLGSVNIPAAVEYGSSAQLGTTGANIPAINVVINGSNLTSAQLEAAARNAVTGALAQAGVKTAMSGTTNKVGK
jgi:hypothetical protein